MNSSGLDLAAANEFDYIAESRRIALVCGDKGFMRLKANTGLILLAEVYFFQRQHFRIGGAGGKMFLMLIHCEQMIQSEAVQKL